MSAAMTISLHPGPVGFAEALRDVAETLSMARKRLGPAPRGALRDVMTVALHAGRFGEPLPVGAVDDEGVLIDRPARASWRLRWPMDASDWQGLAQQARDVLLEAAAQAQGQEKGDTVRDHHVAGAVLMGVCYGLEGGKLID